MLAHMLLKTHFTSSLSCRCALYVVHLCWKYYQPNYKHCNENRAVVPQKAVVVGTRCDLVLREVLQVLRVVLQALRDLLHVL